MLNYATIIIRNGIQIMKFNTKKYIISTLACSLLFSSFTQAQNAEPATFKQAYEAYQTAVSGKDKKAIVETAEQAYLLGLQEYKNDYLNQAALISNYASAITDSVSRGHKDASEISAKAHALYLKALELYQQADADDRKQLVEPYLNLAKTAPKLHVSKNFLGKAIKIAEETNDELFLAQTKFAAFSLLMNTKHYTKAVRRYALEAFEVYQEKLPENSLERVRVTYIAAQIHLASKKFEKAEAMFLEVIKQLESLDYSHPFKLASHARLVDVYEQQGKSDASTEHCIAIGSMKPWNDSQDQVPLFRSNPMYPISYAQRGKSGFVTMSFSINKLGMVINPEVVESKGGKKFEKESLIALKKWRYAPKFEDGKAVKAENIKLTLDFTLEKY